MSKLSNEPQILTLDRPIPHSRPIRQLFYLVLYFSQQHLVSPNKSKLIFLSAPTSLRIITPPFRCAAWLQRFAPWPPSVPPQGQLTSYTPLLSSATALVL